MSRHQEHRADNAAVAGPIDFASHMKPVALALLGAPNKRLSNGVTYRYGNRGSIAVDLRRGTWFNHEEGVGGGVVDLIAHTNRTTSTEAVIWFRNTQGTDTPRHEIARSDPPKRLVTVDRDKAEADARFIRTVLAGARSIAGTIAEAYLRWRHCPLPQAEDALFFHPGVRHPSGRTVPAMVARITDTLHGNRLLGLHLTALTHTGEEKSDLQPRKWMRGCKAGGVVRLCPDDDVTLALGITEGIETGLAVLGDGWAPVWAALDAGNIATFPALSPLALTVFADPDAIGLAAAEKVAGRWGTAGLSATIAVPLGRRSDWNDGGGHDE